MVWACLPACPLDTSRRSGIRQARIGAIIVPCALFPGVMIRDAARTTHPDVLVECSRRGHVCWRSRTGDRWARVGTESAVDRIDAAADAKRSGSGRCHRAAASGDTRRQGRVSRSVDSGRAAQQPRLSRSGRPSGSLELAGRPGSGNAADRADQRRHRAHPAPPAAYRQGGGFGRLALGRSFHPRAGVRRPAARICRLWSERRRAAAPVCGSLASGSKGVGYAAGGRAGSA